MKRFLAGACGIVIFAAVISTLAFGQPATTATSAAKAATSATSAMARSAPVEAGPVFDIPRLDDIVIDGKCDDWGENGFHIEMLAPVTGAAKSGSDFACKARLAWNSEGLLVMAAVTDNEFRELTDVWNGDCIELFLLSQRGSPDVCQWQFRPGLDPAHPEPQLRFNDWRKGDLRKLPSGAQYARAVSGRGYTAEFLLPWSCLGIKPEKGRQVAFQMWFNDLDARSSYRAVWYPGTNIDQSPDNTYTVRLWDSPSPPFGRAFCQFDQETLKALLLVTSTKSDAGKSVEALIDGKPVGEGELAADAIGRSQCEILMPLVAENAPLPMVQVRVGGAEFEKIKVPASVLWDRRQYVVLQSPLPKGAVFAGNIFPQFEYDRPRMMQSVIGKYEIKATFYDREYRQVTTADKPGRYGAVVDVKTSYGRTIRRFVTLFRLPDEWKPGLVVKPVIPGADDSALPTKTPDFDYWMKRLGRSFADGAESTDSAIIMSAIYEAKGKSDLDYTNSPGNADVQWWAGLRRKLYGQEDKRLPECPTRIDKAAPVLREGTLAEAGMKADAYKKLDDWLTKWSKDSDEAFEVTIARHGVIVLHKAYGQRAGKPMTVDTPSYMASLTKLLSGVTMMTAVDSGMIDLDEPIETYLPYLKGVSVNRKPTIRHLFGHSAGMDFRFDNPSDLTERTADILPICQVGERYRYSGTDINLAMKIVENFSGDSLALYFRNRLARPLELKNTVLFEAAGSAQSTSMDMAKIGQMLLNNGSYGNMRFFRQDTFQKMLPVRQTLTLGEDTASVAGIGLVLYPKPWSPQTIGHGAASAATFRADLQNDIIMVMCRNGAGTKYEEYNIPFEQMVIDCINTGGP